MCIFEYRELCSVHVHIVFKGPLGHATRLKMILYMYVHSIHSNIPAGFSWEFPEGFKISPQSGSLSPKQSSKLMAKFSPQSAIVHNGLAVCTFSSTREGSDRSVLISVGDSQVKAEIQRETRKVMKLEGIGKYPHVTVKLCSSKSSKSSRSQGDLLIHDIVTLCLLYYAY